MTFDFVKTLVAFVAVVDARLQFRRVANRRGLFSRVTDFGYRRAQAQRVRAVDSHSLDWLLSTVAVLPSDGNVHPILHLSLSSPPAHDGFSVIEAQQAWISNALQDFDDLRSLVYTELQNIIRCGDSSCPPAGPLDAAKQAVVEIERSSVAAERLLIGKALQVYTELLNVLKCGAATCRPGGPLEAAEQAIVDVQRTSIEVASQMYYAVLNVMDCGSVTCAKPSPFVEASLAYTRELETHYLRTTAAQAFVLVGLGDVISQAFEIRASDGKQEYDPIRTLRLSALGLLIGGFGTANWLRFLEQKLPGSDSPEVILKKACLDATIWAPIANTLYLIFSPLMAGESMKSVRGLLIREFVPVMRAELATFFPYNLVSFSLIPPLVRPFTTGFISMCFAVYISYTTNKIPSPPTLAEAQQKKP